jgi:hypothetical protein
VRAKAIARADARRTIDERGFFASVARVIVAWVKLFLFAQFSSRRPEERAGYHEFPIFHVLWS